MPVYPLEFIPPALNGWYPHMAARDAVIWERHLRLEALAYQGVAYDVALGGLTITDAQATRDELLGYQYSTAQRVDVVGNRGTEHWIIEVRHQARISAVGAALGYLLLAQREPWTDLPLVPVVITDNISVDVRYVAELVGVQVIIVPEPLDRVL